MSENREIKAVGVDEVNKYIATDVTKWKLRKAPKSNWSNIAQYEMTSLGLAPYVSKKTGRPSTGLTKEDARALEKELRLDEGELSDRSKFWRDFQIKIDDKIHHFDLDDAEDQLAFLFCKAHPLVAFGHKELKSKAKATYVLYNDVDEAKNQVKNRNVRKQAYAKFAALSSQEMIDILMVLGKKIISTDPYIIEAMMGEVVEKEATEFLEIAGDKDFSMKLFIMKCIHHDILSRSRGKTLDNAIIAYNDEMLGEGIDKVVEMLGKKNNQQLYLALQKRLETAQSANTLAATPILTGYEIDAKVEKKFNDTKRNITSNAAKGKVGSIKDTSTINEVKGGGVDSGDYDDAPEIL